MLKKTEIWCSQQVTAFKTEVVASQWVGSHKYDKECKYYLSYKEEEVFTLYGFPQEISVSIYFICENDVDCSIAYFSALLWLSLSALQRI